MAISVLGFNRCRNGYNRANVDQLSLPARNQGETENQVLSYAASQPPGSVEACVAKPGLVTGHSTLVRSAWGAAVRWTNVLPNVIIEELAAAMLQQVRSGFEKEPLMNGDLRRIGQEVLRDRPKEA
jgi:hypothetical protein